MQISNFFKDSFKNRVVVVTGAGSGIGKATAKLFAEHEASVVIVDINSQTGSKVANQLSSEGYKAAFTKADVSDRKAVAKVSDFVSDKFGKVDFLINNAGIEFNTIGNIITMPYDSMKKILDVNLLGAIHCTRSLVPLMPDGGKIVNVTSLQGLGSDLPGTSYQVSKAGLIGLTKALAVELAPRNINVNALVSGSVATEGMGAVRASAEGKTAINAARRMIPLGRRAHPYEIAGPIAFLCSPYASYVTGSLLFVDGGTDASLAPDSLKKLVIRNNDPDT